MEGLRKEGRKEGRKVHEVLCLPRNLHVEVLKVLCLSRNLHVELHKVLCLSGTLRIKVHKALYLSRNLHVEVHKVLRLPRSLHVEVHQVLCLPRNLHNFPPCFATGGEYFAAPVTWFFRRGRHFWHHGARFGQGKWKMCTSRFTKCCACPCHKSENEPHVQKSRFTAPVTTMSKVPRLPRKLHFDVKQLTKSRV